MCIFLCVIYLLCKIRSGVTRLPKPGNVWHGDPKCSAGELVTLAISVSLGAHWSNILLIDLWLHCEHIDRTLVF